MFYFWIIFKEDPFSLSQNMSLFPDKKERKVDSTFGNLDDFCRILAIHQKKRKRKKPRRITVPSHYFVLTHIFIFQVSYDMFQIETGSKL